MAKKNKKTVVYYMGDRYIATDWNGEYYEHCYRSDIGYIMNGDWEQDIALKPNGYKYTAVKKGSL